MLIPKTQAKPFTSNMGRLSLANSSSTRSHLTDNLLHPSVLQHLKIPELQQNDIAEGNPYDHINNFNNKSPLYEDERLYYKLFPMTFQGEAIDWYTRSPINIKSWLELCQLFSERFQHNVPPEETLQDLYHYR